MSTGKLVVFEGIDGSGKSTQIKLLADYLRKQGHDVITTFEPTNGPYGQRIRALYTARDSVSKEEELELFLADRKEHVENLLHPSLDAGKIVLCDRYYLSTIAYQGANGSDTNEILEKNSFAPEPDMVLLLQVPVAAGRNRITSLRGETTNDFEKQEMLERVAAIFDSLPFDYIRKIDAAGTIDAVHSTIVDQVNSLFQ